MEPIRDLAASSEELEAAIARMLEDSEAALGMGEEGRRKTLQTGGTWETVPTMVGATYRRA